MTDNHPIAPPPKLFAQWEDDILESRDNVDYVLDCVWRNGFQAGADQELEACCEWVESEIGRKEWAAELRTARRAKPPSLKEEAMKQLQAMEQHGALNCNVDTIRQALEQLDD